MIIYREVDINGDLVGDQNAFCNNCDIPSKFNNEELQHDGWYLRKYESYNEGNWPCLEDSFRSDNCLYCDICSIRLLKCFYLMDLSKTLDCAVYDKEHYGIFYKKQFDSCVF